MDPKLLRYAASHEWASLDGDICTVGISKFAVDQLTDLTHVELPRMGRSVTAGATLGEIESVKAVSDIYSPVAGDVVAINSEVASNPALVAEDPYGKGWMVKLKVAAGTKLDHLMDSAAYENQIASEPH